MSSYSSPIGNLFASIERLFNRPYRCLYRLFGIYRIYNQSIVVYWCYGENDITREHMQNNKSVRDMLGKRGIRPEELPPAEDIKKLERRVASEQKKIEKSSPKLPKKK